MDHNLIDNIDWWFDHSNFNLRGQVCAQLNAPVLVNSKNQVDTLVKLGYGRQQIAAQFDLCVSDYFGMHILSDRILFRVLQATIENTSNKGLERLAAKFKEINQVLPTTPWRILADCAALVAGDALTLEMLRSMCTAAGIRCYDGPYVSEQAPPLPSQGEASSSLREVSPSLREGDKEASPHLFFSQEKNGESYSLSLSLQEGTSEANSFTAQVVEALATIPEDKRNFINALLTAFDPMISTAKERQIVAERSSGPKENELPNHFPHRFGDTDSVLVTLPDTPVASTSDDPLQEVSPSRREGDTEEASSRRLVFSSQELETEIDLHPEMVIARDLEWWLNHIPPFLLKRLFFMCSRDTTITSVQQLLDARDHIMDDGAIAVILNGIIYGELSVDARTFVAGKKQYNLYLLLAAVHMAESSCAAAKLLINLGGNFTTTITGILEVCHALAKQEDIIDNLHIACRKLRLSFPVPPALEEVLLTPAVAKDVPSALRNSEPSPEIGIDIFDFETSLGWWLDGADEPWLAAFMCEVLEVEPEWDTALEVVIHAMVKGMTKKEITARINQASRDRAADKVEHWVTDEFLHVARLMHLMLQLCPPQHADACRRLFPGFPRYELDVTPIEVRVMIIMHNIDIASARGLFQRFEIVIPNVVGDKKLFSYPITDAAKPQRLPDSTEKSLPLSCSAIMGGDELSLYSILAMDLKWWLDHAEPTVLMRLFSMAAATASKPLLMDYGNTTEFLENVELDHTTVAKLFHTALVEHANITPETELLPSQIYAFHMLYAAVRMCRDSQVEEQLIEWLGFSGNLGGPSHVVALCHGFAQQPGILKKLHYACAGLGTPFPVPPCKRTPGVAYPVDGPYSMLYPNMVVHRPDDVKAPSMVVLNIFDFEDSLEWWVSLLWPSLATLVARRLCLRFYEKTPMTAATLTRLARERMLPRKDVAQAVHAIMRKATSIDLFNDYMHCAYLLKWLVMAYPPNLYPQVLHCFDCVLPKGATTVRDQDIVTWIKKTKPSISNVCSYFAELGATHQVPKTWNPKEHDNNLLFLFSPKPQSSSSTEIGTSSSSQEEPLPPISHFRLNGGALGCVYIHPSLSRTGPGLRMRGVSPTKSGTLLTEYPIGSVYLDYLGTTVLTAETKICAVEGIPLNHPQYSTKNCVDKRFIKALPGTDEKNPRLFETPEGSTWLTESAMFDKNGIPFEHPEYDNDGKLTEYHRMKNEHLSVVIAQSFDALKMLEHHQVCAMGSLGVSKPKKPMSVTETSKALIRSIVVGCREMDSAPNVVADVDLARVFCAGSLGSLEPKEPMAITEAGKTMIASINEWCRKMESVTMSHCKVMWFPLVHEAKGVYEDGRTKAHAIFEHSEACVSDAVSDVVSNDTVSDDDIEGDTDDDVLDQDEDEKPPSLEESRIPWILRNLPSIDDYIDEPKRVARENLFWEGVHATVPTLPLGALHYITGKLIAHVYPVTAANFVQSLRANDITPFALYGCAIRCVDGTTTKHIKSLIDILCADDEPC